MNDFLRRVATQESLRRQLRTSDPLQAAQLAQHLGFDVTVGDLVRYQA
ncbi:MAG: Nif11-like leader peptide family natural product precursor, partial [Actinomycetales bacterium]